MFKMKVVRKENHDSVRKAPAGKYWPIWAKLQKLNHKKSGLVIEFKDVKNGRGFQSYAYTKFRKLNFKGLKLKIKKIEAKNPTFKLTLDKK